MVTKADLKKNFAKEYKKYYSVPLFEREGFHRFECKLCGKGYWALEEKPNCGDSSHERYSFFREKPKEITYVEFWKKFADFWKSKGHTIIPRYPVISRWRDDLYFTIASIVDFQRLENSKIVFEYPYNPLIVPQLCLRFPDIANIGVTGRHLSGFMMAGQHAFGAPKTGYWKEECLEYNYEYLNRLLGVDKKELIYGEDVWNMPDFSAFGPCIEAFSKGSELVNSVFMQYYLDGTQVKELPTKVVDVGWGFERLLWYYRGDYTIYDSTFPNAVNFIKTTAGLKPEKKLFDQYARLSSTLDVESVHNLREEKQKIADALGITLPVLEKTIAPMQAIYAVGDHSRSLLFALTDGAIPSNSAGGYNLRVLARRAFSLIDEYSLGVDLLKVMELHARDLRELFPELTEAMPSVQEVLEAERVKYKETLQNASRRVSEVLSRKQEFDADKMALLYESHGVTPELVEKVAAQNNTPVTIPSDYYKKLTEKHLMHSQEAKAKKPLVDAQIPLTKLTYYEKPNVYADKAKVVAVLADSLALDHTLFYPEGGGQCADHGFIDDEAVYDAQKTSGVVLHYLKNPSRFKVGQVVSLRVDEKRRQAITRHHSATHIMIASCRNVLGRHAWQCGSKKDADVAHVDVTHYEKPSREQINAIEALANKTVWENHPIFINNLDRGEAEQKYGFRLYQGGGAIGKIIRVVEVQGYDVEACGGLHRSASAEIGLIKITRVEAIQDGVIRFYYKAGSVALAYLADQEKLLQDAADALAVPYTELPQRIKNFFEEWKERGKELEKSNEVIANLQTNIFIEEAKKNKEGVIKRLVTASPAALEKMALEIANAGYDAVLQNPSGFVVTTTAPASKNDAVALLKAQGAKGGGKKDFARGKIG